MRCQKDVIVRNFVITSKVDEMFVNDNQTPPTTSATRRQFSPLGLMSLRCYKDTKTRHLSWNDPTFISPNRLTMPPQPH